MQQIKKSVANNCTGESSTEDEERAAAGTNASGGFEFQDWADGLFYSLDRAGQEQLLDADGTQVMMEVTLLLKKACAQLLSTLLGQPIA